MSMSEASPERTRNITIAVMAAVSMAVFLLIAGVMSWQTWSIYRHSQDWTQVEAAVTATEVRCHVQRKKKSGSGSWTNEGVTNCEEAKAVVEQKSGAFSAYRYRSQEVTYATIQYSAAGQTQEQTVPSGRIGGNAVVGGVVPIVVNPAAPLEIDRVYSDDDLSDMFTGIAIAGIIALVVMIIGGVIAVFNYRRAIRKQDEAARAAGAIGNSPNAATVEQPVAASQKSSRSGIGLFLAWTGFVVFMAALLFAALAVIGGLANGNSNALVGAGIVAVAGLAVWRGLSALGRMLSR
jgi:FtsH-binding integral membrane protein